MPRNSQNDTGSLTGSTGDTRRSTTMGKRAPPTIYGRAATLVAGLLLIAPGIALAEEEITEWSASVSTAQAGGHPDLTFKTEWKTHNEGQSFPCHCDDARVITQHFPTG